MKKLSVVSLLLAIVFSLTWTENVTEQASEGLHRTLIFPHEN
ncbi:hypothetical protein [Salicibibacter halophilus]|nr:hypothetical protein [Salicibibacter halophilus]